MRKIIAITMLATLATGCASNRYQTTENQYAPWVAIGTGSNYKVLVEPSTIKEVGPGVRKVWYKTTTDMTEMTMTVVDCNTEEMAPRQSVKFINNSLGTPIKFPEGKFTKVYPGTMGYILVKYTCERMI